MVHRPHRGAVLLAVLVTLALAGCQEGRPPATPPTVESGPGTETPVPDGDEDSPGGGGDASATAEGGTGSAVECDAWVWQEDTVLDGAQLGACIASASASAGSGRNTSSSEPATDGAGFVRWEHLDGEYRAQVETVSGDVFYVSDSDCWWRRDGEWVQGDEASVSDDGAFVEGACRLWLALVQPASIAASFAETPGWRLVQEEDVELPDGGSTTAWRIEAETSYTTSYGVEVTRHVVWLDGTGLIRRQETTSSAAGFTVSTINQYDQYGEAFGLEPPR